MSAPRLISRGLGEAEALLQMHQWLSPAFPVSSYAYSHGLETEITHGRVCDAATLENWIIGILDAGAGRTDAILAAAAMSGTADLDALADLARALAGSAERWEETRDQGAALATTLDAIGDGDGVPRAYPVVFGAAAARLNLPVQLVLSLYLQAFAATLVSAGVRFIPLGQIEGQRLQARLRRVIAQIAEDAATMDPDAIGQASFGADLAAMEHEQLDVRIFRT